MHLLINEEKVCEVRYMAIFMNLTKRKSTLLNFKLEMQLDVERGKIFDKAKIKRFDNGFTHNWSEEVFTVCKRIPRIPPVYRIKEDNG